MMVGMNCDSLPGRHVVWLTIPGQQRTLFLFVKDDKGQTLRRAVHSLPGGFQAPTLCLKTKIRDRVESAAFEESLSDESHTTFHFRLILGMPHSRWIGKEAPVLGIFEKTTCQPGIK